MRNLMGNENDWRGFGQKWIKTIAARPSAVEELETQELWELMKLFPTGVKESYAEGAKELGVTLDEVRAALPAIHTSYDDRDLD